MTDKTVEELRAELREAERREAAELQIRRAKVQVRRQFTLLPYEDVHFLDRVYDSTCKLYRLVSTVVNHDEAKTAGHTELEMRNGGMTYVYNTLSHRLVTGVGGGTIWIGPTWMNEDDTSDVEAFEELNAFLLEHPEGGDVTEIVERFRNRARTT